jgi:hypothetical protein
MRAGVDDVMFNVQRPTFNPLPSSHLLFEHWTNPQPAQLSCIIPHLPLQKCDTWWPRQSLVASDSTPCPMAYTSS